MLHSDPGSFWLSLPRPSEKHIMRAQYKKVATPLGALPPPETGFAWASKLIARDVKNIIKAKKTSISKKLDKALGSAQRAADKIAIRYNTKASIEADARLSPTAPQDKPDENITSIQPALKTKKSQHMQKPSLTSTFTSTIQTTDARVFTPPEPREAPDSILTQPSTPVEAPDTPKSVALVASQDAATNTNPSLYKLMSDRLSSSYKTRPFGLPHEERWKNRGMVLLLSMFINLSPLNPEYDKFRNGRERPDQEVLIQQLRRIGSKPGGETVLMALTPLIKRISSMPTDIYTNAENANAIRIDSAHSTASTTTSTWPSWRKRNGVPGETAPSPADLWAAILVAVTYRQFIAEVVEALMHEIDPGMDVKGFLIRIGDPAQRFREGEDDGIREKMRRLLDPEYDRLFRVE